MSLRARFLLTVVVLLGAPLLAGCGARSELGVGATVDAGPDAAPSCGSAGTCPPRIALVGDPGANPEAMLDALLAQSATVTRIQGTGAPASSLDATLLAQLDVVVLEQLTRSYGVAEANALFAWVSAGGGVMSLTGYANDGLDEQRPSSLLAPFGIQYTDADSDCGDVPIPDTGSPVTAGVSQLYLCNGYHVSDAAQIGGTDLTLASSMGAPILISQQRGLGRVLAWGDDWISFDAVFHADEQRFWEQAVAWLGGG